MQRNVQTELRSFERIRIVTMTHLRESFLQHGFDVSDCGDDQICRAVLDSATSGLNSRAHLYASAFALIRGQNVAEQETPGQ